jgi:predicted metalloprotease with PDZ domain
MRRLYFIFYKKEQPDFTETEFERTCELVAGISLTNIFEYVYTTKEPDYEKYLAYAGLKK